MSDHETRRAILSLEMFLEIPSAGACTTGPIKIHRATAYGLDDLPELLHLPGPEAQDLNSALGFPFGPQSPGGVGSKGGRPRSRITVVYGIGITMN